jgi:hypothetical protein
MGWTTKIMGRLDIKEGRWLEWIVEVGLIICTHIKGFSEQITMKFSKLF